jgi:phosphoribosylanthranilate isomerase
LSSPLVKVCGVVDAANALACVEAGADYLGLNFHPASPRSLTVEQAAPLAAALHGRAKLVGLFVDRPITDVAAILCEVPEIGAIQLHGSESVTYMGICRAIPSHPAIIRAFRLRTAADVDAMTAYLDEAAAAGAAPDAILVDALVEGQQGGTGHAIPLDLLDKLPGHPRLILAGGLTPENVAGRVRAARPWMVDVASGVESSPGVKDPGLVAAFVRAARSDA